MRFCGTTASISANETISARPQGRELISDADTLRAARLLERCINLADPSELVAHCSDHVELDSQSLLEPIFGRPEVERYLATEIALAQAADAPLCAVLGRLDAEQPDQPGIIVSAGAEIRVFWAPTVSASGEIVRIFGYTLVPPPRTARKLDSGPPPSVPKPRASQRPRSEQFRDAAGPIRFHGFAVSRATTQRWLEPKLDALLRRFPGSEAVLHVHDRVDTSDEIRATTREKRHFDIVTYPAICVERDGTVYRNGRATQDTGAIVDDVERLLGGSEPRH